MKPYKICCLTYKALDDLVRKTLDGYRDPETDVTIVEGLREGILSELLAAEAAAPR